MESIEVQGSCKQVPRILVRHLLLHSASSTVNFETSDSGKLIRTTEAYEPPKPSIYRFYAALLFVDISGFTVLSQKLDVDHLRLFINAYFKKLIDIVHKYGGDVVKFAGDALYIVWQVEMCGDAGNEAIFQA